MKRKLLLACCALLIGWSNASAQEIGDQYVVGTSVYQITGANLITNGSFDDGVNGWYNGAWTANSIENSTVTNTGGYDDGAYITISAAGAGSTSTLRNVIPVESGKTYLFRCYTSGQIPSRANIGYSGLWKGTGADGHTESDQLYHLQWGERCAASTNNWTVNNYIFTPDDYTFVVIRSSWNANTKLDGFFIGEVSKVSDIMETVSLGSWTGNASFNGSGQHWDGTSSTKYYDNASWWGSNTFEKTQNVDLPAGAYVLKAAGRGAANDGTDAYISLDGNNLFFWSKGDTGKGIDTSGAENYSSDGTYANNNNGRGWEWRTLPLLLFEGKNGVTAKFGYRVNYSSNPGGSWSWAGICEPTLYKTELTTAMIFPDLRIAIAKGQKINDKNAGGSRAISAVLSAAKAISLSSSVSDATTAYYALLAAIPIASDYAEKYALLDNEITKAAAMDIASSDISTAEAVRDNSSSTADQLVAATQTLMVAEYNYVTTTYKYGVSLGEWTTTGSTGSKSDQHWSGESRPYLEQSSEAWASGSWTIKYDQNLTLPAGNYVFKVAGRQAASDGVTLSLTVKKGESVIGTVSDFPKGDTGKGIDKSGATNFGDGEYANSNNGRGWEWRYVKFTLDSDATVNVAVDAVATQVHMWVSFCDATVQTDDDANISLIAYNIALNDANTAINNDSYTNVKGSEKTALQAAIDADEGLDKTDADAIKAATTALDDARAAFTGAKTSYDTFVAAKAVEYEDNLPYASSAKFAAIGTAQAAADATSASDAEAKTNAIISAYRLYVESNALAEGIGGIDKTNLISDANFSGVTIVDQTAGAWAFSQTGGTAAILSGESFTDGDGNANYSYFDYNNNGANNQNLSQTLTALPKGQYLLTVTARAVSAMNGNYYLSVDFDETSAKQAIPAIGNTGGTFGRGWNDVSVVFNHVSDGNVTIHVYGENGKKGWSGATRFRLAKIDKEVSITSAGYATFSSAYPLDLTTANTPTGLEAYYVGSEDVKDTYVSLTAINQTVEANQGILFKGEPGETYYVPVAVSGTALEGNQLVAADGSKVEAGNFVFAFVNGNPLTTAGFYTLTEATTVSAGKAYLQKPATPGVKAFLPFDGTATGVEAPEVTEAEEEEILYNTAGIRVGKDYKGIVINQKGEKFLNK